MSSVLMKRSERYRLVGFLLRVRAAVYLGAMLLLVVIPSSLAPLRIVYVALAACAAAAPFVVRRSSRYVGLRLSAVIDLSASYLLWLAVPWATGISLLLGIWAVAIVVFLGPARSASRIALLAIALELSKAVLFAIRGSSADPGSAFASDDLATDITTLFVRAAVLSGAYFLFRAVERYVAHLSVAAETGHERYRKLMDAAPAGYVVVVGSEIVYANDAANKLLDGGATSLVGRRFVDLVDVDDETGLERTIRDAPKSLEPSTLKNLSVRTKESPDRWVEATFTAIDHRRQPAVQIALHDRSAQRKAEIDLRRTEVNNQEFLERIPVALYRSTPDGRIIQANTAFMHLFGASSEQDVMSRHAGDFYVDAADREHLATLMRGGDVVAGFESRMYRFDGQIIWTRDTTLQIDTDDGVVFEGALIDITARRAIEDELWSRVAQQEAAATIGQMALESEDIRDVIAEITDLVDRVLGTDGVMLVQSRSVDRLNLRGAEVGFDLSPDVVAAIADRARMTAAPVVLSSEAEIHDVSPEAAESGLRSCVAVLVPGVDADFGALIVVSASERLFAADDVTFLLAVANVLAASIDRSDARIRLEDLLRSKDSFVASVSHELRTPLTVVTGMAHELSERWMTLSDQELGEYTAMLVEQSRDMSDLIDDLLVVARTNIGNVAVRREEVDLQHEIESVVAGFTDTSPSTIEVRTSRGLATADPIRVRQILRNLISNALRYGGPNIEILTFEEPGTFGVEVQDDGEGIPAQDHERIFLPYERAHDTEGLPGSVGLGLSVSRTLAELMGGSLTYRFDGRSAFRLELPRVVGEEAEHPTLLMHDSLIGLGTVGSRRIGVDVGVIE